MRISFALAIVGMATAPASAEVISASANGFEVSETVNLVVKPEVAFASFGNIGAWWGKDDTYSGNSANLSLALAPGGCFCERIPESGGGIEHMRVTYVEPGKRVVLTGSLGPLLYEATAGVMDVQVKSTGSGSQLTLNYRAAGFAKSDAAKFAPLVDQVLGEQLKRLRAFVTKQPRT
ncbi:MAG TPA: ATPase [Sphingomicrobium sp.]|nr:ATPase [Sphingomicrobium sp.]